MSFLFSGLNIAFFRWLIFISIFLLSSCSTAPHTNDTSQRLKALTQVSPHYLKIKDGQLEYYRFGYGSPLILITGYGADITSWNRYFLIELARQHEVIAFNNRHVGKSYFISKPYTSREMADDTYQLIKNLNLKNYSVLGISMGGMVAQRLAADYPNKMSHLILINTALPGKKAIYPDEKIQQLMLNLPTNKYALYIVAINHFFPSSWKSQVAINLITDRFKPKEYTEINLAAVTPQQKAVILDWPLQQQTAEKLSHLSIPVLILNGSADSIIPPINSDLLAATIPDGKLLRWRDGGHAMTFQYPQELARAINDFLCSSSL